MDDDAYQERVLRAAMAEHLRAGAQLAVERGETACAQDLFRLAEQAALVPASHMPQLINVAVSRLEHVRASVRGASVIVPFRARQGPEAR